MTTQLPKERLEELAHNILSCHEVEPSVVKAVARALLAAHEQEPVARVVSKFGDPEAFGERELEVLVDIQKLPYNTPFYTHPAPSIPAVVPEDEDGQPAGFAKWANRKLPATVGAMTLSYCEDAWRAAMLKKE